MAVLAAYLAACIDYRGILAPGQRAMLPVLAASVVQARESFRYIAGVFEESPALRPLLEGEPSADTISLRSCVDIMIRPASFRTIRGSTIIGAICEEIAYWRNHDNSANPDREIIDALRPALGSTGGPLIAISSPFAKKGELWSAFKANYGGKGDPAILVAQAETRRMNPSYPQKKIDKAYERDAVIAAAEYGAVFRSDLEVFVTQEIIEALIIPQRFELAPEPGIAYTAFVDPSGGVSDWFTLAIAHRDAKTKTIILDCIRARKPPLSPEDTVREFAGILHDYKITKVVGDNFAAEFCKEQFRNHGITYEASDRNCSELYRDALPLLNSGNVELLDHKMMVSQFVSVERRVSVGGRETITHPPRQHDDIANAVAGALTLVAKKRGAMIINDNVLASSRMRSGWIGAGASKPKSRSQIADYDPSRDGAKFVPPPDATSISAMIDDRLLEMSRLRVGMPSDADELPDMSHLNPTSGMSPTGAPPITDYEPENLNLSGRK